MSAIDQILDLLANGPLSTPEIRDHLKLGKSTAKSALRLHAQGAGCGDKTRGVEVIGQIRVGGMRNSNVWQLTGKTAERRTASPRRMLPDDYAMRMKSIAKADQAFKSYRPNLIALRGNPFATVICQLASVHS